MTNSPTAGMKHNSEPATMPGMASGTVIAPERAPGRRAEIERRLDQRVVHLFERGVERQHHERQIGVDDADIDRRLGVEDFDGLGDRGPSPISDLVEEALGLQDRDPGVDADEEARPERQDDERRRAAAAMDALARAPSRRRSGKPTSEQKQRREGRDAQRRERRVDVEAVAGEQREVLEVEAGEEAGEIAPSEDGRVGRLRDGGVGQADLETRSGTARRKTRRAKGTAAPAPEPASSRRGSSRHRLHCERITAASGAKVSADPLVPVDRLLDEAARVGAGDAHDGAAVELDLVDRPIAEIADVPDLAGERVRAGLRRPRAGSTSFPAGRRSATAWPLQHLVGIVDRERLARGRRRDAPQAALLADDVAFEDVHVADELGDEAGLRLLVDLARRRHLHDPAVVHHGDAVGHGHRLFLVVRDDDEGHAERRAGCP